MKRVSYVLVNLMIALFLYANGAIIANYALRQSGSRLLFPVPARIYETFQLFGVYSVLDAWNHGIELYGVTPPSPKFPEGQIVALELSDYFPYRRMDTQGRIHDTRHLFKYGPNARYQAWRAVAAKIRERYNRAHPDSPLAKVVIVRISWPRREEGPELLKVNERMSVIVAG